MVVASTSAASQSTADGSTFISNVDEEQLARRSEALPTRPSSPSPSHHKQKQKHKRQDTDSKDVKKSFFKKTRTEEDEKRSAQAMYKEQQAAMRLVYFQEDEDEDIKKSLLEQIKSEEMTQARVKALHQDQQAAMRRIVDDEYDNDDEVSVKEETDDNLSESEDEDSGRTASKPFFTAPSEDATQTIAIRVMSLQKALWHMNDRGRRTWTGGNEEWEDTFQHEPSESKTRWLKRQGKCVKEEKSRKLLRYLYNLNELCAAIPEGSDKKQNTFLREHADGFRRATHKASHWADDVTAEMDCLSENGGTPDEDEKTRSVADGIRTRIIPLLVLILKNIFIKGARVDEEKGGTAPLVDREHNLCLIQLMLHTSNWIDTLGSAMKYEYSRRPPVSAEGRSKDSVLYHKQVKRAGLAEDQRNSALAHVEKFRHELLEKQLQLERLVEQPRRAVMAAENDRRIKARRVAEERQRADEAKRHSDAWKSIQGRGTFPPSKSPAAATAHPDYYKKWGWFYEEDKQLLGILEKDQVINLTSIARSFPGRSPSDLQWRILELKKRQRPKYVERLGSQPPEWLGDDYHEFSV